MAHKLESKVEGEEMWRNAQQWHATRFGCCILERSSPRLLLLLRARAIVAVACEVDWLALPLDLFVGIGQRCVTGRAKLVGLECARPARTKQVRQLLHKHVVIFCSRMMQEEILLHLDDEEPLPEEGP